jgi:hypothetical protein
MGVGRGQLHPIETCGAVIVGLDRHQPLLQSLLIAMLGRFGIDADAQSLDPGSQLTCGLGRSPLECLIGHLSCQFGIEMQGLVDDHPCPRKIDQPNVESLPNLGESLTKVPGQPKLRFSSTPGPNQTRPDLRSCGVLDLGQVTTLRAQLLAYRLGHGEPVRVHLGLIVSHLPGTSLQQIDSVIPIQAVPVNRGQHGSQLGTRL